MAKTRQTELMKTLCNTPAKIILSGEHSVVYGKPALSMAIDLPTFCETLFSPLPNHETPYIEVELVDFHQKHAFPYSVWQKMAIHIESRFHRYESGASSINTVLKQPIDLILDTLYHYHHHFHLKSGHWQFKIHGHGLAGKGLGSSAAVIVGILQSLFHHHNRTINQTELLSLAKTIESRQHGQASGIDPAIELMGGLIQYQLGIPIENLVTQPFRGWLIDTGTPSASTGQVVSFVKSHFGNQHPIWQDFEHVTHKIRQAWQQQDGDTLKEYIVENQTLLEEIGIVPEKVKCFTKALLAEKAVAKVCGAGSHRGDNCGILLCLSHEPPLELCTKYGYNCIAVQLNEKGSHCEVVV